MLLEDRVELHPRLRRRQRHPALLQRGVHGGDGLVHLGGGPFADLLPVRRLRHGIEALDVSVRSFQALWHRLAVVAALGADAVVQPDLREFWFLQFGDASAIIAAGEEMAEAVLPQIRTALAERVGFETGDNAAR